MHPAQRAKSALFSKKERFSEISQLHLNQILMTTHLGQSASKTLKSTIFHKNLPMKMNSTALFKKLIICLALLAISPVVTAQNPWNGRVVLQGFWWDYWNNNYPNAWANYLTDLAPRLRDLGIDMVWIPPSYKNAGTGKVGYSPFDHYDLGDKWQKGTTRTRFGNKDEYLRMVAVLHANGMQVMQDIVLNHVSDAGSATGAGGQDTEPTYSMRNEGGFKNFRYVSYSHPATDESAANYIQRRGRWPKNYTNFHPNQWVNSTSGNWAAGFWGPDFCFQDARAFGPSSNASSFSSTAFNPAQYSDYNRIEARRWIVWMKKQTGIDGLRWDAVKHFPEFVQQDLSWNVKYGAGWANGGQQMLNIGEYVGSRAELDTYVNAVQFSNGGNEEMMGTFDFSLRQALKDMTSANGFYDLGSIPNAQQARRFRTVPFVNNHDTFRPIVDGTGNYTGWNSGSELGGGRIDPFDPRLGLCYAIACAVDGSPQIFFEDLFNVGNTGKRWSHMPTSTVDLPIRDEVANVIWCHQKLNFKQGAYRVRWQAQDLLIIERSNRAIIAVNDNWTTWQSATIQTDFAPGTRLKDYSGANSNDIFVDGSGRATIWAPPCNGSNVRRGYCIWGPAGVTGGFNPPVLPTTQEWEMANDLGDSHPSSLRQGGALPANSNAVRTAGRIFVEANRPITVELFPTITTSPRNLAVELCNSNASTILRTVTGTGNLVLTFTPTTTGYYTIRVRNNNTTNPAQNVFVKATYTAPRVVASNSFAREIQGDVLDPETVLSELEVDVFPNPTDRSKDMNFHVRMPDAGSVNLQVFNSLGQMVAVVANGEYEAGTHNFKLSTSALDAGMYFYRLEAAGRSTSGKILIE